MMETIMTDLVAGNITLATGAIVLILAAALSGLGGAVGGIFVGGKALGNDVASLLGSFFGPPVAVPAVAVGLLILSLIGGV